MVRVFADSENAVFPGTFNESAVQCDKRTTIRVECTPAVAVRDRIAPPNLR